MSKKIFSKLYEDDDLLVINKMAGILSIPDRYNDDLKNLYNLLKKEYTEIFPLHRLDRETSGIMIYAKNEEAHKLLSEQFLERKIEKRYLALVAGNIPNDEGVIETFLAPSLEVKDKIVVTKKGKKAITEYKVLKKYKEYSWVSIQLHTGRQHQIRVHLQHIGYPLAVDSKYGNKTELFAHEIKKRKFNFSGQSETRPLLKRHSLHASKLVFTHPETNQSMTFEAELPKDLRATLNQLDKWDK